MVSAIILLLGLFIAGLVAGVFLIALIELREIDNISDRPPSPVASRLQP